MTIQGNKKERNGKAMEQFLAAAVFFLLISTWFFRGVIFNNEVFISADTLCGYYPWNSVCKEVKKAKNGMMMDSVQTFYPDYSFTAKWVSSGRAPLWMPHILCGTPFLACGSSGLFYPLSLPFFIADKPAEAFGWGAFLHLMMAGIFAYLFLRTLGTGHRGAMIGGLVFCFNGWLTAWMIFPSFLHAGVWLPLMLCLYEISVKRRRPLVAALGGVAGAMPILSGQVQVGAYSLLMLSFYALYRIGTARGYRLGATGCFVLGAIVTGAISSVQLLPTLELAQASQRAVAESTGLPFDMKHLVLAFLPNFYGDPVTESYWGNYNYPLFCCYLGALPAILAIGATIKSKQRVKWFFVVGAAVALMMAMGSPLNALVLAAPGLNRIPSPRILFLFTFCVSMLAGFGWSAYEKESDKKGLSWLVPWVAYLAVFGAFFAIAVSAEIGAQPNLLSFEASGVIRLLALAAASMVLFAALRKRPALLWAAAIAVIFLDLGLWSKWYNPSVPRKYLYPETQSTKFLLQDKSLYRVHSSGREWMLFPNSSAHYGFFDIRGVSSLYIRRYKDIISEVARKNFGIEKIMPNVPTYYGYVVPITSMLNVKYIMSDIKISPDNNPAAAYEEIYNNDMRVTLNKLALPRFYAMSNWTAMGEKETLDIITSRNFKPEKNLYLRIDEAAIYRKLLPDPNPDRGFELINVSNLSYTPDEISMTVRTVRHVILASSEANFKGWRAFVDGKEVPILTSNYHFRSIPLPVGTHTVEYKYQPRPAIIGAASGLAVAALLSVICAVAYMLNMRKSRGDEA